jgi:uncharacterized repeat protein (TIGR01451 family)
VGPGSSSGTVTVVDSLPASLTATGMNGTGWNCVLATLTCTRSDVLANGSAYPVITLTVNVANNAPASVTNTATVSGGGELNTTNDTANDVTTVNSASTGMADLAMTKNASPSPITAGTNLTYSLSVTNNGPSDATTVTITDTLPDLVTFVPGLSSSSCQLTAGNIVTCKIGVLAAGQTAIAIVVVVPSVGAHGRITNTATVSADQTDPNPGNNSASATVTVKHGPPIR